MNKFNHCKDTHTILEAQFLPSPFCNQRPSGVAIELLVVHCISLPPGEFGGKNVQKLFLNQLDMSGHPYYRTIPTTSVSSHLFIERDGSLYQFVPFNQRAWHAGESEYLNKTDCNDFSIGIELEGTEDIPYTHVQYEVLARCTQLIIEQYPSVDENRIVGHSDIAPKRKTDPGPSFDWDYYRQLLKTSKQAV